jgi:hypothetical protein
MRKIGTNSYRYVNGSSGGINSLKGNFDDFTEYEWQTKAWCTGNVDANGDSDPMYHSGWGEFSSFTTDTICGALPTNLSTMAGNGANTALSMNWDSPQNGNPDHYFLELTNETTGQTWAWNNIAGNSNSKTKYGLTNGNNYSWRIRGACGSNGTSWATSFTSPVYYTLGGQRISNPISNFKVYPNPSKGIFHLEFSSQEQSIKIELVNMLGKLILEKEIYSENGKFKNSFELSNQSNGIYLLKINYSNGMETFKLNKQ